MGSKVPTTLTLVAATATTITLDGAWSKVHLVVAPSGGTVYARGDGQVAAVAADLNFPVFPSPDEGTCIPVSTATGLSGTSTISVISAGTPTVSVLECNCD
jgi:hypothetical protein